jgi:hypothetical protein
MKETPTKGKSKGNPKRKDPKDISIWQCQILTYMNLNIKGGVQEEP